MNFEYIKQETSGRKGIIVLNRPDKRNALNEKLISELKRAFSAFIDSSDVKVIIMRAEGKVFSAGADLAYLRKLQENSFEENLKDSIHLKELFLMIYTCEKPVIAQVQGHAIAGGCGLINICDFVFASEKAKFGYTEVGIGFIPAMVMVFLIRKIGEGRAKELLLGGNLIDARTALKYGLVNKVVAPDDLENTVNTFADDMIIGNSSTSMALTKRMINKVTSLPVEKALDYAAEMNAKARSTEDCKRGLQAFLNKEDLRW